jgi:magnesium transporter
MEAISFEKLFALLRDNRIKELKDQLVEMNVVDIAEFMMELEGEKQLLVFRILPKDLSAMVFAYLEPESQKRIVEYSSDKEVNFLVEELYVDDAVDFLEEVPANVVKRVLANASPETRDVINRFLKYPEDSAGSLMTIEFVELHDRFTVADAIRVIRRTGLDKETIYTCYVIDDQRHLVGILPLRRLLLSDENARIRAIMADDEQIISVHTLEDQGQWPTSRGVRPSQRACGGQREPSGGHHHHRRYRGHHRGGKHGGLEKWPSCSPPGRNI